MRCLPKSTVLSLAFMAGVAMAAHAQSVANLPPAGASATPAQPPAYAAPQARGTNPGGGTGIPTAEHFQKPADWDSNRAYHPYTTSGTGPSPGAGVTANNEPTLPTGANLAAPYSSRSSGSGPSAGAGVAAPSR